MKEKRKYRRRQKLGESKQKDLGKIVEEISMLIDDLGNCYSNTLLSIREDLIRARARIKERVKEE